MPEPWKEQPSRSSLYCIVMVSSVSQNHIKWKEATFHCWHGQNLSRAPAKLLWSLANHSGVKQRERLQQAECWKSHGLLRHSATVLKSLSLATAVWQGEVHKSIKGSSPINWLCNTHCFGSGGQRRDVVNNFAPPRDSLSCHQLQTPPQ